MQEEWEMAVVDYAESKCNFTGEPRSRACTWSNYKHKNTAKILLGIAPQGIIAFVAESVSDKYLTEHWYSQ